MRISDWSSDVCSSDLSALVCHGVFARFPELRIAAIENGGEWVVPFLRQLGDVHKKMPHGFDGDPIEQFKRNVWISPFHEDDIAELIEVMGADHILFGSDYPHPEGLAVPDRKSTPLNSSH